MVLNSNLSDSKIECGIAIYRNENVARSKGTPRSSAPTRPDLISVGIAIRPLVSDKSALNNCLLRLPRKFRVQRRREKSAAVRFERHLLSIAALFYMQDPRLEFLRID